ncbi:hypothetical protein [Bartonella sp. ML70XJBT.G]|uniref:hypothetical protein n=1 Tax=Bartonella sp. ML70XJBT.G TaxID=3019093 RepID=UPI00235FAD8B|nr:hypothetical protein [Bartonella sp. ML70XJBT.G]
MAANKKGKTLCVGRVVCGTVLPVVEEVRFWRWLSVLGVRFVTQGVVLVGGLLYGCGELVNGEALCVYWWGKMLSSIAGVKDGVVVGSASPVGEMVFCSSY